MHNTLFAVSTRSLLAEGRLSLRCIEPAKCWHRASSWVCLKYMVQQGDQLLSFSIGHHRASGIALFLKSKKVQPRIRAFYFKYTTKLTICMNTYLNLFRYLAARMSFSCCFFFRALSILALIPRLLQVQMLILALGDVAA